MGLATDIQINCNESIQVSLEQIEFFQDQIKIIDNEKVPYDESIRRLDANLLEQVNVVNRAFNDVETAYQNRITANCKSDLFWRITSIDTSTSPIEYGLICTKLAGGAYVSDNVAAGLGSTVFFLNPTDQGGSGDSGVYTPIPASFQAEEDTTNVQGTGSGYAAESRFYGYDPRNYYGLKYYDEPYSEDIGNTFVTSFIGTITQGTNTLTIMNPIGAGVSYVLKVGQIIFPEIEGVFAGTTKITAVNTGFVDLRNIESLNIPDPITESESPVNIITVDNSALQSVKAPQLNGTYGSFEILDDPDTVVDTGRYLYQLPKEQDPFVPQTVGIMQTANVGIGVSIALNNSGHPTAAMGWDPNLNGWDVSMDPNKEEIIHPPAVGAGRCLWKPAFDYFPKDGSAAAEGDTATCTQTNFTNMYQATSTCSGTLNTAVTDAIGIASTKETDLIGDGSIRNLKADGLNALRGERNEKYSLRIFGMRVSVGQQNEDMDRLATLRTYLGDATIRDVMDESIPPTGA
jgi:hypothetical protein